MSEERPLLVKRIEAADARLRVALNHGIGVEKAREELATPRDKYEQPKEPT